MKVLCVAEKPSIAKSIVGILSGGTWQTRNSPNKFIKNYDFSYNLPPPLGRAGSADFTVTSVLGHLTSCDFGEDHRKWSSCDPFALFDAPIHTFVDSKLKDVDRNLQQEARHADLLMIWTDCDREGEHIGSEVVMACRKTNRAIVVKRARFSAIIPAQIHQACRQAVDLDMRQADAVEARIQMDLRIGAAFTRLTTMGLQGRVPELAQQVISYGPCQFPTLGFVVDQYNRVQSFIPETFWYIYVAIEREDEDDGEVHTVEFKWKRNHLFDMEAAVVLYEQCVDNPLATVLQVDTKPTTKWKPLPLTTVELQQSGSRLLHMAPKKVLDIAEKLYQKGILSYPRTETDQYDKAFDFNTLLQKQTYDTHWGAYAQSLLDGAFQRPRNGKKNDKAHPPIHPTSHAGNLEGDERRVFELVTRRFLASCSTNAEGNTTTVEAEIAGEHFSTSGLVILHRNYLDVYPYDKWSGTALPNFQVGEQFMPTVCELKEGSTSKPNLLTEADLVGLMDKNGIGTDATIAEHIAKIIEREYVREKQEQKVKYLVPSTLGVGLVEGYNAIGFDRSLSKPHLRRETEHRMQMICDGVQSKQDVLAFTIDQYKEVFIKARREFGTVIDRVIDYLHGDGEVQAALRNAARGGRGGRDARGAARGSRGGRGGRGGGTGGAAGRQNGQDDVNSGDDSDGGGPGGAGGAGGAGGVVAQARGTGRGRGRGTATRGRGGGARAGGDGDEPVPAPRKRKNVEDIQNQAQGPMMCQCEVEAILRTAGPNTTRPGKSFWTCAKPNGQSCGLFEWADENGGNNARAGPSRPVAARSHPVQPAPAKKARPMAPRFDNNIPDDGDVKRCECGLEAKRLTVAKAGDNQGRPFWACPNSKRASCGFFEWDDDGGGDDALGGLAYGQSANRGSSRGGNDASRGGRGGGTAGGQSGECFKCGESGHWSNACPNQDGPGPWPGHRGNRRGVPSDTRSGPARGNDRGGASDECYKCHQTGHWASQCPSDRDQGRGNTNSSRQRPSGGGGGSNDECYKCHQTGHWASTCPNERSVDGGGGRSTQHSRGK